MPDPSEAELEYLIRRRKVWWLSSYDKPIIPRLHGFQYPRDALQLGAWATIGLLFILWFTLHRVQLDEVEDIVLTTIVCTLGIVTISLKILTSVSRNDDPASIYVEKMDKDLLAVTPVPTPEHRPCYYCRQFVFKTSKHCSSCDKCVQGFDHHCRWLNTCVGRRNYKRFFFFVLSTFTTIALQLSVALVVFSRFFTDREKYSMRLTRNYGASVPGLHFAFLILGIIIQTSGLCAVGNLLCFHIYLFFSEQTTYSWIKDRRERKLQRERERLYTTQGQQQAAAEAKVQCGCFGGAAASNGGGDASRPGGGGGGASSGPPGTSNNEPFGR